MVTAPVLSGILQYDPLDQSKIIGDLAQRWEVSPDGLTYTFFLTPGVKWHDGKPFTSEDAMFSLNRVRTPPTGMASPRKGSFAAVDKVETPDKDTLKITLKYPSASFLDVLAMGWNLMVPKQIAEPLGGKKMSYRENIGTGPFKFKEFISAVSIDFVKNPDYFVSGRPYLDGFRIYIIRDVAATQAAFRTGNVNMTYFSGTGWLPSDVETAKKARPDAVVQKALNLQMPNMGMNTKRKPFDDPRVRKAIFLAIDRQVGNQVVQQNEGRVGGPFPPTSPWALPESELLQMPGYRQPKDQDLAEAKRLLAEAGYATGFKTALTARPEKINQDLSVFLVDQLRKLNIQAEIQTTEVATFLTNVNGRNFDLFEWTQALATDDPDQVFGDFYITKAGRNFEDHTIPGFDELFDKQSRTLDPAERKKLVLQMQKTILDNPAKVIVVWQTLFQLFDPAVRNYKVATRGIYNNQKFQDVWLAK
ncbi:MAG: ABC transporter substrate-binding protein [Chloroflexota bacterium]|nr:ABC transporter substrate-binding protein [Chloroflexota bacterium]